MGKTYRRGDGHFLSDSKSTKKKKARGPGKKSDSFQEAKYNKDRLKNLLSD
jgi:hypothetical protein